jgi:phosphatidylinositol glycan class C protein
MTAAAVLIPVEAAQFHGAFSLNAALFATVLLASRLESNEMVFAFVFLAIETFAFFPLARHLVRRSSVVLHLVVTLLLVAGTVGALVTTSTSTSTSGAAAVGGNGGEEGEGESEGGNERTLLVVYLMTVVFVMVVCPVWLQHIYKYKNTIRGPWDVAEIEKEEGERN